MVDSHVHSNTIGLQRHGSIWQGFYVNVTLLIFSQSNRSFFTLAEAEWVTSCGQTSGQVSLQAQTGRLAVRKASGHTPARDLNSMIFPSSDLVRQAMEP